MSIKYKQLNKLNLKNLKNKEMQNFRIFRNKIMNRKEKQDMSIKYKQ